MPDTDDGCAGQYGRDDLQEVVLKALRAVHGGSTRLEPSDLNVIDEFHIRGRDATAELAALSGDLTGRAILDVGSGLGGTARYLASNFGCRVTGIDLTPAFVSLAAKLSELVSLSSSTEFRYGSALRLPFQDGCFDAVWLEHVQMNIGDKSGLARELARVLRSGGRLCFHEIFADAESQPYFPVPWAERSSESFLVSSDQFRRSLEQVGMQVVAWKDVTEAAYSWVRGVVQQIRESGPPPFGVHLLMGATAQAKLENVERSLEDQRIQVVQAVFARVV